MNPADDPLSIHTQNPLSKSTNPPKRPNPYTVVNLSQSTTLRSNQPSSANSSPDDKKENKTFVTNTSYSNPFAMKVSQNLDPKPKESQRTTSFADSTISTQPSTNNSFISPTANPIANSSNALFHNGLESQNRAPINPIKKAQPILFNAGGQIPDTRGPQVIQKKELKGIFAFFGSETLPPNPKKKNIQGEVPQGLDAIPVIFNTENFTYGYELTTNLMKRATNADEKMYLRIIKIYCCLKLQMWDKITLELSAIGNLDKIIFDPSNQIYLPFNLRLIYALLPFFNPPPPPKGHASARAFNDKTLERLFSLLSFCESKVNAPYPEADIGVNEGVNIQSICDTQITPEKWVCRIIRVTLIIMEILLMRSSTKIATELMEGMLEKFPHNSILLAYQARLKMMKGDYADVKIIFDNLSEKLPKDEYLEFLLFNSFMEATNGLKYSEATTLLTELSEKYSRYSLLAKNNLFYLQFAECKIKESIETLESFIKKEPWNINEILINNLLMAYDFYYIDTKERRRVIQEIVEEYGGSEFNKEIFEKEHK